MFFFFFIIFNYRLYKFYSKARESVGIQINNLGKSDSEEHIIHDLSSLQDEYNTELDGSNPKQSKCTLDR